MPLTYDDCETNEEKRNWSQRRKRLDKIQVEEDTLDVAFDKSTYLNMIKRQ